MAKKQSKNTSARKPRVSTSSRTSNVSGSAARTSGKKRGFSVQKSGNAYNVQTPLGVLNTRRGCSRTLPLLILPMLLILALAMAIPTLGRKD